MGNSLWTSQVGHPIDQPTSSLRIKVRMTEGQLKELMAKVDKSKLGDLDIGRLILQECFEGRCHDTRVTSSGLVSTYPKHTSLGRIKEE